MKGLGLAGAGLGAAAAAAPVFHDLSELSTSAKANFKQPWYVKELELETSSAEIDWGIFQAWQSGPGSGRESYIVGYAPTNDMERQSLIYRADADARKAARKEDGLKNNIAGYQLRDVAYSTGAPVVLVLPRRPQVPP